MSTRRAEVHKKQVLIQPIHRMSRHPQTKGRQEKTMAHHWFIVGPTSATLDQQWTNGGPLPLSHVIFITENYAANLIE